MIHLPFRAIRLSIPLALLLLGAPIYGASIDVVSSSSSGLNLRADLQPSDTEGVLKGRVKAGSPAAHSTAFPITDDQVSEFSVICFAHPLGSSAQLVAARLVRGKEVSNLTASQLAGMVTAELALAPSIAVRDFQIGRVLIPRQTTWDGTVYEVAEVEIELSFSGTGQFQRPQALGRLDSLVINLCANAEAVYSASIVESRVTSQISDFPLLRSSNWLRISVTTAGLYRITPADLQGAGITVSQFDPRNFRLFHSGGNPIPLAVNSPRDSLREMAIRVVGEDDGVFSGNDFVLFYANGGDFWDFSADTPRFVRHPYSDRNVFYLALDGQFDGLPKRMANSVSPAEVVDTIRHFTDRFHFEEDVEFARSFEGYTFDYYNWYWGLAGDIQLFVGIPAPRPFSVNTFRVRTTRTAYTLRVNGTAVDADSVRSPFTYFHTDRFAPGVNQIDLDYIFNDGYTDYVEIDLQRDLTLPSSGELLFYGVSDGLPHAYSIASTTGETYLLDVSEPSNQKLVAGVPSGSSLIFRHQSESERSSAFMLAKASSLRTPASIVRTEFDNIVSPANGADLIIITHENLHTAALEYATYRASTDGLRVRVVKMSDIYAHFSGGRLDPLSIREFLRFAFGNWSGARPSYCLLAGDGVYDFRDNLGTNAVNYVPPFIAPGDESVSDENFVYFGDLYDLDSDDSYPSDRGVDMVIARWPVKTQSEFRTVFQKTTNYEQQPDPGSWRNLITLIADDENHPGLNIPEIYHTEDSETLATYTIPPSYDLAKIYGVSYPFGSASEKPEMREAIIRGINRGTLVVNYVGHGNQNVWADERVFRRVQDIPRLQNSRRLPLIFNASCSIGFFDDPRSEGMAEDLLRYAAGGAVGTISATRLVYSRPNFAFNKAGMIQLLGENDYTIAEAIYVTKLLRQGAFGVGDNDRKYIYIGDPLTRLARAPLRVNFSQFNPDSLVALTVTELSGVIEDAEGRKQSDFNGTITVAVFDNQRFRTIQIPPAAVAQYFEYGPTVFRGDVAVAAGEFSLKFVVPKDITFGGRQARISGYATSATSGASGVIFPIAVGSINKDVSDTTGPEIRIYFNDNPNAGNGSSVPRSSFVTIELFDSLGINLSGEIGHGIELVFNESPDFTFEVTDSFSYFAGSYQRGRASLDLPPLGVGEHTVRAKAWDSANNSNQQTIRFTVTSDEGLQISDLLCYPNPVADQCRFSYVLSADADNVTLRLFTLSGIEIWSVDNLPGSRGYNGDVTWDGRDLDGDKIANGVYIFQLTARPASGTASGAKAVAAGKLVVMK